MPTTVTNGTPGGGDGIEATVAATQEELSVASSTINANEVTAPDPPNASITTPRGEGSQTSQAAISASDFYSRHNCSFKVLVSMAIGLLDGDGAPLFDSEQHPWNSGMLKVTDWKPRLAELASEIERRWHCYSWVSHGIEVCPRAKHWKNDKAIQWLEERPITWQHSEHTDAELDAEFVRQEMAKKRNSILQALSSKAQQMEELEGAWNGMIPLLRLLHCLIDHDDIRKAFLHRYDSSDKDNLENRNSTEKRDPTVWELMSGKWNNKEYNPKTEVVTTTEGNDEFRVSIPLDYSLVASLSSATPEKCEIKFNEMSLALKRIMQKWERSGQGDGGVDEDEDEELLLSVQHELGSLENRSRRAISNRAGFFKYNNLFLLYMWDMIEKYDLRRSCNQTLDKEVSSGDGGADVPNLFDGMDDNAVDLNDSGDDLSLDSSKSSATKSTTKSSKSKKQSNDSKEMTAIATNLAKFHKRSFQLQQFEKDQKEKDRAHATKERRNAEIHATKERLNSEISGLEGEKRNYEWQLLMHNSKRARMDDYCATAAAMQQFIDGVQTKVDEKKLEVAELDAQLSNMIDTPQKSNRTP